MAKFSPEEYDAWHGSQFGSFCHRTERDALFSLTSFQPGERVLDAGCGTGMYLMELKAVGVKPVGLDKCPEMLRAAKKKRLGVPLVRGDLPAMPFKDEAFAKVVSVCTLEFMTDPLSAFKEFQRVLFKDGSLVLGFLNRNSPWAAIRRKKAKDALSLWHGSVFMSLSEIERHGRMSGLTLFKFVTAVHFPPEARSRPIPELKNIESRGEAPSSAAFMGALFRKFL